MTQRIDLWLSSLVVHELEFGLHLTPPRRRRERLGADLSRFLGTYAQRILHLDRASADWAAWLRADAVRSGHPADLADMLIAGTALAHYLTVATRNVRGFRGRQSGGSQSLELRMIPLAEDDVESAALAWL